MNKGGETFMQTAGKPSCIRRWVDLSSPFSQIGGVVGRRWDLERLMVLIPPKLSGEIGVETIGGGDGAIVVAANRLHPYTR